ncbi:hypothetical protein GEV33_001092 [Tenebrio molitor]|uniref:Glucose-methanol-choline oxidoreductase C-terminal domain-containing protein n=1 Tax=Tenebrio molitor TaxID=7067 RepID=A0A8J6HVP1_TENMO|nr:hypothetical protein GEV33_001092 [Tenebrio molitor]
MSSTGMSQVTARINSKFADPSGTHPDMQIFFAGYLANCAQSGEVSAAEDPENPDAPRHLTISAVVLHPKSRGYVGLKTKNPLDPPLMYANYLTEPEDMATLVEGIRVTQRLANTRTLQDKYGLELIKEEYGDCEKKHTFDSDDFWQCAARYYTGPENHQAGSCKMGPSTDPLAVVDPKLQLYGIEGIRVMDASIMPVLVSGNTHATIVMIADKGVEHIKQKWLAGNTVGNSVSDRRTHQMVKPTTIKDIRIRIKDPEIQDFNIVQRFTGIILTCLILSTHSKHKGDIINRIIKDIRVVILGINKTKDTIIIQRNNLRLCARLGEKNSIYWLFSLQSSLRYNDERQ